MAISSRAGLNSLNGSYRSIRMALHVLSIFGKACGVLHFCDLCRIAAMIEKRTFARHRVLKRGMLAFSGGGGIDCTVRNLSANGAQLDVESAAGLPRSFTLVIETDQFMRRCRPIWFNDRRLGVVFE